MSTTFVNDNAPNWFGAPLAFCSPHLQEADAIGEPTVDFAEFTPPTRTTVLIIDDNYHDRKHWSNALRGPSFNYLVLEAPDADDGRKILQNQKVDCVLLDFDMPLCGFFTLIELVPDRERPNIAVIMLTCLVHPLWSELTKQNGAQAWLVKQHTSTEILHHAIHKAIGSVKSLRGS